MQHVHSSQQRADQMDMCKCNLDKKNDVNESQQ